MPEGVRRKKNVSGQTTANNATRSSSPRKSTACTTAIHVDLLLLLAIIIHSPSIALSW